MKKIKKTKNPLNGKLQIPRVWTKHKKQPIYNQTIFCSKTDPAVRNLTILELNWDRKEKKIKKVNFRVAKKVGKSVI